MKNHSNRCAGPVMRNVIRTAALLVVLGSRVAPAPTMASERSSAGRAIARVPSSLTQDARLIDSAPIGHRQPHARDVPAENPGDLEHLSEEDAAVDRKLIICRGC
jgi:hypothetical protein